MPRPHRGPVLVANTACLEFLEFVSFVAGTSTPTLPYRFLGLMGNLPLVR